MYTERFFRHPVAAYYNKDNTLAYIRFAVFNCKVKPDYNYTWVKGSRNTLVEAEQEDTCYYSWLTRFPLVILPDKSDMSYIDISAEDFMQKPNYYMSSKYLSSKEPTLWGLKSISKLYTDGTLIEQSFQALGAFEPMIMEKNKLEICYIPESSSKQGIRILIFDHTLDCRVLPLNTLMRLGNKIKVGNMDVPTGTVPTSNLCCPLTFIKYKNTTANDGLSLYNSAVNVGTTKNEVSSLTIQDGKFSGTSLIVPDNIKSLTIHPSLYGVTSGLIENISCPREMIAVNLSVKVLKNFLPPEICSEYRLNAQQVPSGVSVTPKVMTPMRQSFYTNFEISNVSELYLDQRNYACLRTNRISNCKLYSNSSEVGISLAVANTWVSHIELAPNIDTIRLYKHKSLGNVVPKEVILELNTSGVNHDIKIIVDDDIGELSIRTNDGIGVFNVLITGSGKIRNLTVSGRAYTVSNAVRLLNITHTEVRLLGTVKNVRLYSDTHYYPSHFTEIALNNGRTYAEVVEIYREKVSSGVGNITKYTISAEENSNCIRLINQDNRVLVRVEKGK